MLHLESRTASRNEVLVPSKCLTPPVPQQRPIQYAGLELRSGCAFVPPTWYRSLEYSLWEGKGARDLGYCVFRRARHTSLSALSTWLRVRKRRRWVSPSPGAEAPEFIPELAKRDARMFVDTVVWDLQNEHLLSRPESCLLHGTKLLHHLLAKRRIILFDVREA